MAGFIDISAFVFLLRLLFASGLKSLVVFFCFFFLFFCVCVCVTSFRDRVLKLCVYLLVSGVIFIKISKCLCNFLSMVGLITILTSAVIFTKNSSIVFATFFRWYSL